jgi:iron complex transport system ATP-binding protein
MMGLVCRDVGFRYRTGRGVAGVTFAGQRGELLGIVGPNSAGKSTLLRVLSKVLTPACGQILVAGADVSRITRRELARTLAVVPQNFSVAFPFQAAEIVGMGRYPHAVGGSWDSPRDREVVRQALLAVGILELASRRVDELSGGERQLVSVARALAQEPSVLLLDEPTTHLDLRHQRVVMEVLLRHCRERGGTALLVSHDLNLAAEHCDRLLLLAEGQVRAFGLPEEVITAGHLASAYDCPVEVGRDPHSGRPHVHGRLVSHATDEPARSTLRM